MTLYILGGGGSEYTDDSALSCDWLRNKPTVYCRISDYEHNAYAFVGAVI